MDPRIAALVTRLLGLVQYADGRVHWRRLVIPVLALALWALDAWRPELLAAHWYGDAYKIVGMLLALAAIAIGRDVQPVTAPVAPLTAETLEALVTAAAQAAADVHRDSPNATAAADLGARYLAEALKPHVMKEPRL